MIDREEYQRWREMADDAASVATAQDEAGRFHWACFFAEQAVQFAAKALLHGVGVGGWGHDLADLADRVAAALEESLPPVVRDAMLRLSRHYIATRYPDAHAGGTPAQHYGPADAAQARADLTAVMDYLTRQWAALDDGDG